MSTAFTSTSASTIASSSGTFKRLASDRHVPHLPESSPNRSNNRLRILVTAAVLVGIALWKPWGVFSSTPLQHAPVNETARRVTVVHPTQAAASNVVLPATFRPWQTASLHARVSGYLLAWHHDLGSHVKAGDLLAEIETPELDQELAEAEALANEADAAVVQAEAERLEAQADLKVAEAQLTRAEAELALAKSQLVRRDRLLNKDVITREEHETFSKDVEARSADVLAAKADVARRKTNLDTRAATISARQATARSRRANVERLKELQAFKRIVAPFDGVVTRRTAEVGMLVTPGKESLFTLEDMSRVRVQINVPQTYAAQTTPGATVTITVPESSAKPVVAKITRVADSIDSGSRTMLAEIELENTAYHFQPGSYAQVVLAAEHTAANWTIPTNTLTMRVDGPHVAMVNDENRVELRPVTLGRDLGRQVIVVDGIGGGERLIVNPSDSLTNGLEVHVVNREQKPADVASTTSSEKGPG